MIGPGPRGKGIGISFGLTDLTKEAEDELLRQEIVGLLADRGIGMAELAWRLKRIYIERGSPFGLGVENFVRWIKPPPSDPSP